MTGHDSLASDHSDLNAFLFSDVSLDAGGGTLSVLSALARQDLDPWEEAGRLAALPRPSAAASLAGRLPMADAAAIAARLVTLLPARGGAPGRPAAAPGRRGSKPWMLLLVVLAALLAVFASQILR